MTSGEFEILLQSRLEKTQKTLGVKAVEYATEDDRLHNFKLAASHFSIAARESPAEVLIGMMRKHWASIADLVNRHWNGSDIPPEMIDEKIGDAINYLILLEATLRERMK